MPSMLPRPRGYVCPRAIETPAVDGRLDERAWGHAPWSAPFVDIEANRRPAPRFETRVRMLWDDDALYIGARLEEPHVWGTLVEHDATLGQFQFGYEISGTAGQSAFTTNIYNLSFS